MGKSSSGRCLGSFLAQRVFREEKPANKVKHKLVLLELSAGFHHL